MNLASAIASWQAILGSSAVVLGSALEDFYGADASGFARDIPAALRIDDARQLPEVMRVASRNRVPVYPISTGRNWGYGTALPARDGCVIVDLSNLRRVIDFDAELGVITLEPGVTQGMLAEFLDAGSHPYMVPVTGAGPTCSLIGNALERGYGITPYADHFGAVTDIEAVLADGSMYRTALRDIGGAELARLFKWGIGPYSAGLFAQSGFGVVTRMSIVLARRPACIKVCLFSLRDDDRLEPAVAGVRTILSSLPGVVGGINLMNRHRVLAMTAPFPSEQLGPDGLIPESVISALGQQYQVQPWTGVATLYGTDRVVKAAQKEIRAALAGLANRLLFITPARALTLQRVAKLLPGALGKRLTSTTTTLSNSLELVAGRPNETALPLAYWRNPRAIKGRWRDPSRDGCGLIWYSPLVPMRSNTVRNYLDMVKRITKQHGMEPLVTMTSISDRLFDSTVPLIFERDREQALQAARDCLDALVDAGRPLGCYPYRFGVDSIRRMPDSSADSMVFHARLRRALDPDDLLAPGRYVALD